MPINLTNPMMMKGPIRELIPVGPHQVRVRLLEGVHPKRVHLLASGKSLRVQREGLNLNIEVPGILDHEVVAIDL